MSGSDLQYRRPVRPSNARPVDARANGLSNPLIRKLEIAAELFDDDRAVLQRLCARSRPVEAHQDLTQEDDRPENVHLIIDGFACRYKMLPNGQRHIMALLVPGDFCDLHVAVLGQMDHSIATLSACSVVMMPRETVLDLTENHPRIARALWWATLVDEGILREWLVNIGQRQADKRMAHLFCEMMLRLRTVGLVDGDSFVFPLTQTDLGDILGLTNVHVNRTLQDLRSNGLIRLGRKLLEIPDVERLKAYCGFNPNYLHLTPRENG